jgi:predicted membrane protein
MRRNFFSLLFGLFLILLGLSSLLSTLGYPIIQNLFKTFWPLFVIGLAVSRFMVRDVKGGIIMGVIGVVAQLNMLGLTNVDYVALLFPLIIIMIGISSVSKGLFTPRKNANSNALSDTTLFGGLEKNISDQEFSDGSFITLFGATEVNLTKAKFKDGVAVIDALVAFGGAEIKVPEDCKVELEVTAIFGGSSDKRVLGDDSTNQTLKVKGYVLFGAIEVK